MALIYDKATFDALYSAPLWSSGIRGASRVPRGHYQWACWHQHRARQVAALLPMLPGTSGADNIAIVGGAYGWTAEALAALGRNAVSVDPSAYIADTQNTSEEADIRATMISDGWDPDDTSVELVNPDGSTFTLAEAWQPGRFLHPSGGRTSIPVESVDISINADRNKVRNRLGSIGGIMSEFVLDDMTDNEVLDLVDAIERLKGNSTAPIIHMVQESDTRKFSDWENLLSTNGFTSHVITGMGG